MVLPAGQCLLGAYLEARRSGDVDNSSEGTRRIGWLARRAHALGLVDDGELRRGRVWAKRRSVEAEEQKALLFVDAQLRFPERPENRNSGGNRFDEREGGSGNDLFGDQEDEVERFKRRRFLMSNLRSLNEERRTQLVSSSSSMVDIRRVGNQLTAPQLSFDWEAAQEEEEDAEKDELEVEVPSDRRDSRRDLFKEQMRKCVARSWAEALIASAPQESAQIGDTSGGVIPASVNEEDSARFDTAAPTQVPHPEPPVAEALIAADTCDLRTGLASSVHSGIQETHAVVEDKPDCINRTLSAQPSMAPSGGPCENVGGVGASCPSGELEADDELVPTRTLRLCRRGIANNAKDEGSTDTADGVATSCSSHEEMVQAAVPGGQQLGGLRRLRRGLAPAFIGPAAHLASGQEAVQGASAGHEEESSSEEAEDDPDVISGDSCEEMDPEELEDVTRRRLNKVNKLTHAREEMRQRERQLRFEVDDATELGGEAAQHLHMGTATMSEEDRHRFSKLVNVGATAGGTRPSAPTRRGDATSLGAPAPATARIKLVGSRDEDEDGSRYYLLAGATNFAATSSRSSFLSKKVRECAGAGEKLFHPARKAAASSVILRAPRARDRSSGPIFAIRS